MREVAIITVDELNVHSEPGGDSTKTGKIVKRGQRFEIIKRVNRPQAEWAQIVGGYIALHNHTEVFARIERIADTPRVPDPAFEMAPWMWLALAAVVVIGIVVYAL